MNPSLPPKKREQRPPEEDFKFPAPLQTRRPHLLQVDKELLLLPPPPPPPPLSPLPLALPWHLPYYSPLHAPYPPGQVRDRRGPGSPTWRDGQRPEVTEASVPQSSSWLRGWPDYTPDSRDPWPYGGHARRDYASSVLPHLFPRPPVYLSGSRPGYLGRRPNGLDSVSADSADRQHASVSTDSRARRAALKGSLPRDTHPISRNTDGDAGFPKARARGEPPHQLSPGSAPRSGAQIYYALGSLYPKPSCPPPPPPPPPAPPLDGHAPSPEPYRPSVAGAVLPHFARGSLIELAGGRLKRVEEMRTEDFLRGADASPQFHLSTCTVLLATPGPARGFYHLQVLLTDRNSQEQLTVLEEYPFFVRDRGWSSCCPRRSAQLYGLHCRQLSSGDVCLALMPTPTLSPLAPPTPATSTMPTPTPTSTTSAAIPTPSAPPTRPDSPEGKRGEARPRRRRWSAPELRSPNTEAPRGGKRARRP